MNSKKPSIIKNLVLVGLCLILLLSPIVVRIFPNIEPIEYKYALLRDWSKSFIELFILIFMLIFLVNSFLKRILLVSDTSFGHWLVGLFLMSIFSLSYTVDSGLTIRAVVDLGSFIILYFLVINTLTELKYSRCLISFLLGIAVALSIYGIYQYFFEYRQLYGLLDDYMARDTIETRWDLVRRSLAQRRISSAFGLHNMFASFLGMVIPVSLAFAWYEKERKAKLILLTISLIMLLAMLFTFSIGGWLSLFFALCIECILLWKAQGYWRNLDIRAKRRMIVILVTCITILVIVVSLIVGIKRFPSLTDRSFESRWMYLVSTIRIIKDNFFIGSGWGTFENIYLKYMLPGKINPTQDYATVYAHNLYLQILVEIGIIGLMVFGIFITEILKYGFKKIIYLKDRYIRFISIGVFSGICFFLIHNLLDIGFYFFPVAIFWWFLVGNLVVLEKLDSDISNHKSALFRPRRFAKLDILVWATLSVSLIILIVKNSLADLHFYKGSIYLNKGLYEKSIEELEKAAKLDSFNKIFPDRIGDVYFTQALLSKKSFFGKAKVNYLKALNLSSYNSKVYSKLGLISYLQGDWQEAVNYYKKAIYYYPADEEFHRALGIVFLNRNQVQEAFLKYKDLKKLNPKNPENLFFGAKVYEKLGNESQAIKMYKDILSISPNHPDAMKNLNNLSHGKKSVFIRE